MRFLCYNYVLTNGNIKIEAFTLRELVADKYANVREYAEYYVLADGVDAKEVILNIMALALGHDISIAVVDPNDSLVLTFYRLVETHSC